MKTLAHRVWHSRYRAAELGECSPEETFARVARALAGPEGSNAAHHGAQFLDLMASNRFLPGGRILANGGRDLEATLANCFVSGTLEDSLDGIFRALQESALTLQAGGGIGIDFSPLRPRGTPALRTGQTASGPVSFIAVWNQMSETLLSTNPRRGAMMGVLDCSHPDIFRFIAAKDDPRVLHHFNLSVLVSDAFMQALAAGSEWPLRFGEDIAGSVPAAELWQAVLDHGLAGGEPGLLFIDQINAGNRLGYRESIRATNPCGELPLPPHGACVLGSLVLPSFVRAPFSASARLDFALLEETVRPAVRMLDNALEIARLPLSAQRQAAQETRRIGIGCTGLADMLAMLGLRYDSAAGRTTAAEVAARIRDTAALASCELAQEKGAFPALDAAAWLANPVPRRFPEPIAARIRRHGLRNSHLTAIAPTGSLSLLAGNVSSGIEPIFDWDYSRRFDCAGDIEKLEVTDCAVAAWREMHGARQLPDSFVRGRDISAEDQVQMVAALQPWVDSGISKTLAIPPGATTERLDLLYRMAYREGLKGIAAFPSQAARGAVLDAGAGAGECADERARPDCPA